MRAALASVLVLPACLIAPDRPVIPPGIPITVGDAACLAPGTLLDTGTVGQLPGGRDAVFRVATTPAMDLVIYELGPMRAAPECYVRSLTIPNSVAATITAMDVTLVGDQDLIALMIEDGMSNLSFDELLLDDDSASLTSQVASTLRLPVAIGTVDSGAITPRFLRRMPLSSDLWFGGGPQIGVLGESALGVVTPPAFYTVDTTSQNWLDVAALPAASAASTAMITGEIHTCSAHEVPATRAIACDAVYGDLACPSGLCPGRATHAATEASANVGYSGYTENAITLNFNFHLQTLTSIGKAVEFSLPNPSGVQYSEDLVLEPVPPQTPSFIATTLWYPDDSKGSAVLVNYTVQADQTATLGAEALLADPNAVTRDLELQIGHFTSTALEVLVIGDTATDLQCFVAADLTPCPPS